MWMMKRDGSELTQFREGFYPEWSPDGEWIVFEYRGDIWRLDKNGKNLIQLTNTAHITEALPTISRDGNWIAFVSDEGRAGERSSNFNIWIIDKDGSNKQQITELEAWDSWPQWGPDGIYFLSGRGSSRQRVQRIWKIILN
jgi:Tol biopolymer transport system component